MFWVPSIYSPITNNDNYLLIICFRFSSSDYQTTNYGLGGLCETHLDAYGYLEGVGLTQDRLV